MTRPLRFAALYGPFLLLPVALVLRVVLPPWYDVAGMVASCFAFNWWLLIARPRLVRQHHAQAGPRVVVRSHTPASWPVPALPACLIVDEACDAAWEQAVQAFLADVHQHQKEIP